MTWDEISTILQIIGGIVLGASFVVGIAIIWVGLKANKEKEAKVNEQAERIAELELKRAEAEERILELQERNKPRMFNREVVLNFLKGRPTGTVEILFDPTAPDAHCPLGIEIIMVLEAAGWDVVSMKPIPLEQQGEHKYSSPPVNVVGGSFQSDLSFSAKRLTDETERPDTPYGALWNAFKTSGLHISGGSRSSLPENIIRIVINPRPLVEN